MGHVSVKGSADLLAIAGRTFLNQMLIGVASQPCMEKPPYLKAVDVVKI